MVEEFKLLNPEATIIVTGFVTPNDLPLYFSLTDVFVQPSLRDGLPNGLPNALLEAMAWGRAVIGTPVGGIPDVVTDCENGRLVSTLSLQRRLRSLQEQSKNYWWMKIWGCDSATQPVRQLATELDGNLAVYRRLGLKL